MEIFDYSDKVNEVEGTAQGCTLPVRDKEKWITFHYSGVVYEKKDRASELQYILNETHYHKHKDWGSYANHYMYDWVVLSDGLVVKTHSERRQLWHCGNTEGNKLSWSIHVLLGKGEDMTDVQKKSVRELFDYLRKESDIPLANVRGHCEWGTSECPGPVLMEFVKEYRSVKEVQTKRVIDGIDFAAVRTGRGTNYKVAVLDGKEVKLAPGTILTIRDTIDGWSHIDSEIGFISADLLEDVKNQQPNTQPKEYTVDSPIINKNDISIDNSKIASKTKQYTAKDVDLIVSYYKKYGEKSGVDWIIALAQCLLETGWLTSWWSARPRRNPAGIGVTGEKSTIKKGDDWAKNGTEWCRGHSFKDWDDSVQAHIGHLLCYTIKEENMTEVQKIMSTKSPRKHLVTHGCASTIKDLSGKWATDKTYAQKIVKVLHELIG